MNQNIWGDFQICISVPLTPSSSYIVNKKIRTQVKFDNILL